jgi:hypothetical protein
MRAQLKRTLVIGVAVLSVGLCGVVAYAIYTGEQTPTAATPAATPGVTPDPNLPMPSPSAMPAQGTGHALKQIVGDLVASAGTYLGMTNDQLMTELKGGKSLADVAAATPGKSRDGLVAALTTAADQKIDAVATAGTLTSQQAAMAKSKVETEIGMLVDRTGPKHG